MRQRLLLIAGFLVIFGNSFGQIVGTQAFLQGHWLEVGEIANGSFGTSSTPAGYHPHFAPNLAMVYDFGYDGWASGAPNYMGDYTYPGFPQEGWAIQVNGQQNQAFQAGGFPGTGSLTGSITSYSNTGGIIRTVWTGTAAAGALAISMETRVDTNASWVVMTTTFNNTSGTTLNNIYYERTCDPDNDESWPGGSFTTTNTVSFQNDVDHRVLVSAVGQSGAYTYMGLGTKDCRAKACYFPGLSPVTNLQDIYNGTGTAAGYSYAGTNVSDQGYGLVYSLGNLAAGASAIISYGYAFNNISRFDSAFPEPLLVVNNVAIPPTGPAPAPTIDTFNACNYPGMTTLNVKILNATDKCWSWSTWTWSPATALGSTTGVNNTIDLTSVPGSITYTITGTDSSVNMLSCNHRVMYLTVNTCHHAFNNSPCVGDTLKWTSKGDSTGATYVWYGPKPSTTIFSTQQSPWKYPSTFADSGWYYTVKTVSGISDTDSTYVVIHPLPVVNVSSNQALCGPMVDSLILSALPDSVGETFAWTGPNGFTSTLEFPVINPFALIDTGYYTVHATTIYGCKNSGNTFVYPGIVPGFYFLPPNLGCEHDTVTVVDTSHYALTYSWDFGDGTIDPNRFPAPHIYIAPSTGAHTIHIHYTNAHCVADETHTVDTRHSISAGFTVVAPNICVSTDATNITDGSAQSVAGVSQPVANYEWNMGDGTVLTGATTPTHTYSANGTYSITLTVTDTIGCTSAVTHIINVLEPFIHALSDTTICLTMPLMLDNYETVEPPVVPSTANDYTYMWSPATGLSSNTAQIPGFFAIGDYTITETATLQPYGCVTSHTFTLHSVLPGQLYNVSADATIAYGQSFQLNADSEYYYTWTPNDGSLSNNNISNPVATPSVTTTYTVYAMDKYGCRDTASVVIHVDSTTDEFIPSAFSPNGDGHNDLFKPVGIKFQKLVEFRIYNRWGQQVFYSNTADKGWDGTFNGEPQDLGTYYYVMIVARSGYGENYVYKGEITLIR